MTVPILRQLFEQHPLHCRSLASFHPSPSSPLASSRPLVPRPSLQRARAWASLTALCQAPFPTRRPSSPRPPPSSQDKLDTLAHCTCASPLGGLQESWTM